MACSVCNCNDNSIEFILSKPTGKVIETGFLMCPCCGSICFSKGYIDYDLAIKNYKDNHFENLEEIMIKYPK